MRCGRGRERVDLAEQVLGRGRKGWRSQEVVKAANPSINVRTTRSPLRTSAEQREEIRKTFERARRDAYPLGLDPDR